MNKKNLQYLSLALIIAGGYYFFMKGKKSNVIGAVPLLDEAKPISEKPKSQPTQPTKPTSPNYDDVAIYVVNTASGKLNIVELQVPKVLL